MRVRSGGFWRHRPRLYIGNWPRVPNATKDHEGGPEGCGPKRRRPPGSTANALTLPEWRPRVLGVSPVPTSQTRRVWPNEPETTPPSGRTANAVTTSGSPSRVLTVSPEPTSQIRKVLSEEPETSRQTNHGANHRQRERQVTRTGGLPPPLGPAGGRLLRLPILRGGRGRRPDRAAPRGTPRPPAHQKIGVARGDQEPAPRAEDVERRSVV